MKSWKMLDCTGVLLGVTHGESSAGWSVHILSKLAAGRTGGQGAGRRQPGIRDQGWGGGGAGKQHAKGHRQGLAYCQSSGL